MNNNYLYVIIRRDMPNHQKIIQTSHITWEVCKEYGIKKHPNVILISVKNEESLDKQIHYLENNNLKVFKFYEPLMNNQLSGIGVFTSDDKDRSFFKKYNLIDDLEFMSEFEKHNYLLKNCKHRNLKPGYVETLGFEFSPKMICSFCSKSMGELSEKEKIDLYISFSKDILEQNDISKEKIDKNKNGFNL